MQTSQKRNREKGAAKFFENADCGKTQTYPQGKTKKVRRKRSYARSYPQYAQKSTTSVVQEKACQARKFVLEFVIKSQKGEKKSKVFLCRVFVKIKFLLVIGSKYWMSGKRNILLNKLLE